MASAAVVLAGSLRVYMKEGILCSWLCVRYTDLSSGLYIYSPYLLYS